MRTRFEGRACGRRVGFRAPYSWIGRSSKGADAGEVGQVKRWDWQTHRKGWFSAVRERVFRIRRRSVFVSRLRSVVLRCVDGRVPGTFLFCVPLRWQSNVMLLQTRNFFVDFCCDCCFLLVRTFLLVPCLVIFLQFSRSHSLFFGILPTYSIPLYCKLK